jgi:hypothetical protein
MSSKPVQLWLQEGELDALDEFRRDHKSPPPRPGAATQLLRRALADLLWAKEANHVGA